MKKEISNIFEPILYFVLLFAFVNFFHFHKLLLDYVEKITTFTINNIEKLSSMVGLSFGVTLFLLLSFGMVLLLFKKKSTKLFSILFLTPVFLFFAGTLILLTNAMFTHI